MDLHVSQMSRYPALNRFDKHLPVPKSYIAVGVLSILTIVRILNLRPAVFVLTYAQLIFFNMYVSVAV